MWKYEQSSGKLFYVAKGDSSDKMVYVDTGYAGKGEGKNNTCYEDVKNIGPLPRGKYQIQGHFDSKHTGPYTIALNPDPANNMFGRSAFRIHGDLINDAGEASEGCIVLKRSTRERIESSGDALLEVY